MERNEENHPNNLYVRKKKRPYGYVSPNLVAPNQQELKIDMNIKGNNDLPVPRDALCLQETLPINNVYSTESEYDEHFILPNRRKSNGRPPSLGRIANKEAFKHYKETMLRLESEELCENISVNHENIDQIMYEYDIFHKAVNERYDSPNIPKSIQEVLLRVHRDGSYFEDISKDAKLMEELRTDCPGFKGFARVGLVEYAYRIATNLILFKDSYEKSKKPM